MIRLLIPPFIAVAMLSACKDPMDEMTIDKSSIETFGDTEVIPPKNKIKLPPGYNRPSGSITPIDK